MYNYSMEGKGALLLLRVVCLIMGQAATLRSGLGMDVSYSAGSRIARKDARTRLLPAGPSELSSKASHADGSAAGEADRERLFVDADRLLPAKMNQ